MYVTALLAMSAMVGVGLANPLAKEEYAPDTLPYENPGSIFREIAPTCEGGVFHDGNSTGTYKEFGGSECPDTTRIQTKTLTWNSKHIFVLPTWQTD
jgi:hypothetical protein